jgi:glycosyltransferase involved in cell wall biosynthesis
LLHLRPPKSPGGGIDGTLETIVQVVSYYPPHLGGVEVVAQSIAEGLTGHARVEVLTSSVDSSPAPRTEVRGHLRIRRLRTLERANVPFIPTLLFHLLRFPRRAVVHVHIAQAYVPEMVWIAAWLRRRPYIAHFHLDCDATGRFGWLFLIYKRRILPHVLRGAARVIALSEDQAEFLRTTYDVAGERIVVMPNGVGEEFFRDPEDAPSHDGPFRLLYVGRLSAQKNVARLLRAMAEVRLPVELVVVGDGDQRAALQRLQDELGLTNVRMVGLQMGEDLMAWYRWADAFTLASDKEGMPLVLLEAMAAGLPIVATDVPGIADTVGEDGLLAPPDPSALGAAIDRLAGDPALRADLARRSYERGRRYAWTTLITTLLDLYRNVDRDVKGGIPA